MNKNIIITGSSGFIGQYFFNHLSDYINQVKLTPISLRNDWKLNTSADAIIHLAAKAEDKNSADEKEYFYVNRDITIKLFDEFLKSDIQDFIYFSSIKAVSDIGIDILDENTPTQPQTIYGRSKLAAEDYLLTQILPKGKRLFIIRPCLVYGVGNKGNFNLLYKMISKGIPWIFSSFENKRSFLNVKNLTFCIASIIKDSSIESGIYHIADDESISTNDLVSLIGFSQNKSVGQWRLPKRLIEISFKCGDLFHLPVNSKTLNKLTGNYVVSNKKIKSALGIEHFPVSLKEGLLETLLSFNSEK